MCVSSGEMVVNQVKMKQIPSNALWRDIAHRVGASSATTRKAAFSNGSFFLPWLICMLSTWGLTKSPQSAGVRGKTNLSPNNKSLAIFHTPLWVGFNWQSENSVAAFTIWGLYWSPRIKALWACLFVYWAQAKQCNYGNVCVSVYVCVHWC